MLETHIILHVERAIHVSRDCTLVDPDCTKEVVDICPIGWQRPRPTGHVQCTQVQMVSLATNRPSASPPHDKVLHVRMGEDNLLHPSLKFSINHIHFQLSILSISTPRIGSGKQASRCAPVDGVRLSPPQSRSTCIASPYLL